MIHNVIKIALFLIVNTAGFYTVPVVYVLATKFGLMPHISDEHLSSAQMLLFTVGPLIWPFIAVVSVGYFFASKEWRPWLLLAPIYVPALYVISVITYFHFV